MFHSRGAYVCRMNNTAEKRTMSLVVYAILSPVQSQLFLGLGDKKNKQDMLILYLMNYGTKQETSVVGRRTHATRTASHSSL